MKREGAPEPWHRGPVALAGNWEPLIFRRRMNYGRVDLAEQYRREHTEAAVLNLKRAGVNLLVTHYFKGFGLRGEAEDMRNTERLIPLAHRHGVRVGGYVGDTLIHETFLQEEPAAADWVQRRADGRPVSYGGTASFRWKWCRVNPAFRRYMKRVLRRGVNAGLDLIHFDNWLNKPEPERCHCWHCTAAFRAFLRTKFTAAERKERLGFADCSRIRPPTFSEPLYIAWADDIVQNPLLQEWVDFQCQTVAEVYRELAEFCRRLRPDIAMECNPTGIWGENAAYMRSVDHARLLPHGQFFWDESPNAYGLLETGALATNIRSMKMGQALGNRTFFYTGHGGDHAAQTRAGEALAFNGGCLGMIAGLEGDQVPVPPVLEPYVRLLHAHPEWFIGTRSPARVAVYRNFASLAFNGVGPHLQALLAEQTLIQHHIPFDLVFALDRVGERLLLVPGMECLDAGEIEAIRAHARRGGEVVLVGDSGRCDGWRRAYTTCPFGTAFDRPSSVAIGRGVIRRIPALRLPKGAPTLAERVVWDTWYTVLDSRFWMLPENAGALLIALRHADPAAVGLLRTNAGPNTVVEARATAGGRDLCVHVINYERRPKPERLQIRLECAARPRRVVLVELARSTSRPLPFRYAGGAVSFAVPNRAPYLLVVAEGAALGKTPCQLVHPPQPRRRRAWPRVRRTLRVQGQGPEFRLPRLKAAGRHRDSHS